MVDERYGRRRVLVRRAAVAVLSGEQVPASSIDLVSDLADVTGDIAGMLTGLTHDEARARVPISGDTLDDDFNEGAG